jgi:hypothetical protein
LKNITRKSSAIMTARLAAMGVMVSGYCLAVIIKIRIAATATGGTIMGVASGDSAIFMAFCGSLTGSRRCWREKIVFNADIRSIKPAESFSAVMLRWYLSTRLWAEMATSKHITLAIKEALIATARLKDKSALSVIFAKIGMSLIGPSSMNNMVK